MYDCIESLTLTYDYYMCSCMLVDGRKYRALLKRLLARLKSYSHCFGMRLVKVWVH